MTAPASTASAIVDQLLELLATPLAAIPRDDGYAVEVMDGWPGDQIQTDVVIIGDHTIEQSEAVLGARHRHEVVTVELEIMARRDGGTTTEVRHAVYEIADAVCGWARSPAGFTAGGSACWLEFNPVEYRAGIADRARSGWLRCTVKAHQSRL